MAEASAFEQYLLEQINHARLAPQENFDRYISSWSPLESNDASIQNALSFFGVSATELSSQVAALTATAPVAWNSLLNEAATGHSETMVATGDQAHYIDGSSPGSRATEAGYSWNYISENIYAYAKSGLYGHAGFMVDWGFTDTGIQDGAGHRVNIMNASVREVGIGVVENVDTSTGVGPNVVTQNFGNSYRLAESILLGVVRTDADGDDFYSIGEGTGSVRVTLSDGETDATPDAGGYRLDTSAGDRTVTFSGGDLATAVSATVTMASGNAKLDLVDGTRLETSVDLILGDGAEDARFIGDNGSMLTGNSKKNVLEGNGLDNRLCGLDGRDQLGGGQGADTLKGGKGADKLLGGRGVDTLKGGKGADKLYGGKSSDRLDGGNGDDKLDGGKGNDTLIGGSGDDQFLFRDANFGHDRITHLDTTDTIRITASGEAANLSQLQEALSQTDEGVLYDHLGDGINTITIVGTPLSQLDLGQFDLG